MESSGRVHPDAVEAFENIAGDELHGLAFLDQRTGSFRACNGKPEKNNGHGPNVSRRLTGGQSQDPTAPCPRPRPQGTKATSLQGQRQGPRVHHRRSRGPTGRYGETDEKCRLNGWSSSQFPCYRCFLFLTSGFLFSSFAQVSRSVTVRLKTRAPGLESLSTQK